jgi:hypothetical protein
MIIYFPLLIALIGVLMYGFCANPKLQEIGKMMFWTGLLAFLLTFGSPAVNLLRR